MPRHETTSVLMCQTVVKLIPEYLQTCLACISLYSQLSQINCRSSVNLGMLWEWPLPSHPAAEAGAGGLPSRVPICHREQALTT